MGAKRVMYKPPFGIPNIKRFGRKRFSYRGRFPTKEIAQKEARHYRRSGALARVVPMNLITSDQHLLYVRMNPRKRFVKR